jgi:hypothetical protein
MYDPECFWVGEIKPPAYELYWKIRKGQLISSEDWVGVDDTSQVLYNADTLAGAAVVANRPNLLSKLLKDGGPYYMRGPDDNTWDLATAVCSPDLNISLKVREAALLTIIGSPAFSPNGVYKGAYCWWEMLNSVCLLTLGIVAASVEAGENVDGISKHGYHFLSLTTDAQIWDYAITHGVSPGTKVNNTTLLRISLNQQMGVFKKFLSNASKDIIDSTDSGGKTILDIAVIQGYFDKAKLLLDAGADASKSNQPLLACAMNSGQGDLAMQLLSAGAKVTEGTLSAAVRSGMTELAEKIKALQAESIKKNRQKMRKDYNMCSSGAADTMSFIYMITKDSGIDLSSTADITARAADAVSRAAKGRPTVILGRDAEPVFWRLKEEGLDVRYFLVSRNVCSSSGVTDTAVRKWWRLEVPRGAVVIDTGYAGSIISAIRNSIDFGVSGYLICSGNTSYPELQIAGNKPSHKQIVVDMEKIPKPIGRITSMDLYTGLAYCPQSSRDSDERVVGFTPAQTIAMRMALCHKLGVSEDWAQFTGITHEERVGGVAALSKNSLFCNMSECVTKLLNTRKLYHCGDLTCEGCGNTPMSPTAILVTERTGEGVAETLCLQLRSLLAKKTLKEMPEVFDTKVTGCTCNNCQRLADIYRKCYATYSSWQKEMGTVEDGLISADATLKDNLNRCISVIKSVTEGVVK